MLIGSVAESVALILGRVILKDNVYNGDFGVFNHPDHTL